VPDSYNSVWTNEHPVASNWETLKESHCNPQGWCFYPLAVPGPSSSWELKNQKVTFLFAQCPQQPAPASAAAQGQCKTELLLPLRHSEAPDFAGL